METTTRPWYKVRWQVWVISLAAILIATYLYQQSNKPLEISTTSGPAGQDKTLKQRMVFLVTLEKSLRKNGYLATLELAGEEGKTLIMYWEGLSFPFAKRLVKDQGMVADIREMGFKRLVLRNNKMEWHIDLKN